MKMFDIDDVELSTEDIFDVKEELKNNPEFLVLVEQLVSSIKKDVVLNINNDLVFKVTPYKTYIGNIDKYLTKKYGLEITHIPSYNTYQAYTKDSFLTKALMSVIFNKDKNKNNLLKDVLDQLPRLSKSQGSYKASGKNEEALVTFIKADFYNMIITEDANTTMVAECILAEINIVLENIKNMRDTIKSIFDTIKNIEKNGIDKILIKNNIKLEGMSNTNKIKAFTNILLSNYSDNIVLVNPYNVFKNLSTENISDGRDKLPWGTRLSYLFLLLLLVAIVITIITAGIPGLNLIAAGLTKFPLVGYGLTAYIVYTVLYAFTRILIIIFTGYDIRESPKINEVDSKYRLLTELIKGDTELNKKDKDLSKTSEENVKFINKLEKLYNGKFSTDISNESIDNIDMSKYIGYTI